jgi:NTP pyrophosphatase (non-canonical NTP hydrolase)
MNGNIETKSEIRARIDELQKLREMFWSSKTAILVEDQIDKRLQELHRDLSSAEEDLSSSIIRSHKAICKAKQMDEKAAYGNDPAVYYTLGICGEAGEMANAIVKAQRNGADQAKVLEAIKGELPDVVIYSYVLAYVLDIDLSKLVNEKVEVVIDRANKGYYGRPLSHPSGSSGTTGT